MQFVKYLATGVLAAALLAPGGAAAQVGRTAGEPGEPASARPGILGRIGIDQRIGERLPLDLPFTDEHGRAVTLGDYFGRRPVVLALVYYECPMLCTQVLNGLVTALTVMDFEPGREFDVLAVSFSPREGPGLAAQKKKSYVERYGRPHTAGGWHFLTGPEESIATLTEAVGFRYELDRETQQFAHGAAVQVLTPDGVLSRYFYGIEYSSRDLRFGLMEASEKRIGSAIDQVLLLCYHYDPATGKYGATVLGLVRVGGILLVVGFFSFLAVSLRRERAAAARDAAPVDRT